MSSRRCQWRAGVYRRGLVTFAVGVLAVLHASGCSWVPRVRPLRDGERLELESAVVHAPSGEGWMVSRHFDAGIRTFDLVHKGRDGAPDRWLAIGEIDGAMPLPTREALVVDLSSYAKSQLSDEAARVEEVETRPPSHLGASAITVAIRAKDDGAQVGPPRDREFRVAQLAFVSAAGAARTGVIRYDENGTTDADRDRFEASWQSLLESIDLRPASPSNIAAAARADGFPKRFEPGLARRSLTLPQMGFQWALERDRWLAPGGFTGAWGLALGVTDRLELDTPGFLRLAFGEFEALTRPEFAIGAGLTGFEHSADRGSVWAFGVSAEGRKRLAPDLALLAGVLGESAHESKTGRTIPGGGANAGIVWDVHPYVSLGIGAGWSAEGWQTADTRLVWVGGGASTPLVTVHLPLIDLVGKCAAAWDHGRPGVLAGASFLLTL